MFCFDYFICFCCWLTAFWDLSDWRRFLGGDPQLHYQTYPWNFQGKMYTPFRKNNSSWNVIPIKSETEFENTLGICSMLCCCYIIWWKCTELVTPGDGRKTVYSDGTQDYRGTPGCQNPRPANFDLNFWKTINFCKKLLSKGINLKILKFPSFFFLRVIDCLSDHKCSITANCPITPVQSN